MQEGQCLYVGCDILVVFYVIRKIEFFILFEINIIRVGIFGLGVMNYFVVKVWF